MEILYLIISIIGFIRFFVLKRRFDFLTIGFISQQLYFSPCIVQIFIKNSVFYLYTVHIGVYFSGIILVLFFLIFSYNLNNDLYKGRKNSYINFGFEYHSFYATLIAILSFIVSFNQVGLILFTAAKAEVLSSIDRFYILWTICSLYGMATSFIYKKKILLFINIFLILITIYIGFRSIAAIAVIGLLILTFVEGNKKLSLLFSHYKKIIIGLFAGLFFLIYKGLYIAIKFQNYDMVLDRLKDGEFYRSVLLTAEPFGIQRIFSDVIKQNFYIGLENLDRFFLLFTLFGDESGIDTRSFNQYFQPALYGDVGYGMGSNVWAHMYSSGGWLLFIIFSLLYTLSLRWFSKIIYRSNINYLPLIVCLGSYWSFYIHRNDLFYQLGLEKRILIVFVIVSILSLFTSKLKQMRS